MASLVNDVDLVVVGRPTQLTVKTPQPWASAGPILATLKVDETLAGVAPGEEITVVSGQRVVEGGPGLLRIGIADDGLCTAERMVLFLRRTPSSEQLYNYPTQGWVRLRGETIGASYGIGEVGLFGDYESAAAVIEDVQRIAQQQESQGIPKGRLRCEAMRPSADYLDPPACPGDTLNPYEAFGLGGEIAEAFVVPTDPGPSARSLGRTDLSPDDPRLLALIQALKLDVTLEPVEVKPQDLIYFYPTPKDLSPDALVPSFAYSPSKHIVQLSVMGQFAAPAAFEEAMQPFLATGSAQ